MMLTFKGCVFARTAFGCLCVGLIAVTPVNAQDVRSEKIVDQKLSRLPPKLALTETQRKRLRSLWIQTAQEERQIMLLTPGRQNQRIEIGKVTQRMISREKKILTPTQMRILEGPKTPKKGSGT